MNISEKVKTLESSLSSGKNYLELAKGKLASESVDDIKTFRDELWEFIRLLMEKWFSNKQANKEEVRQLQQIYDDLRQNELLLAKRIVELQKDQSILKNIDSVALPEESGSPGTRDVSKWNVWPMRYSKRLRDKLSSAKLPQ